MTPLESPPVAVPSGIFPIIEPVVALGTRAMNWFVVPPAALNEETLTVLLGDAVFKVAEKPFTEADPHDKFPEPSLIK